MQEGVSHADLVRVTTAGSTGEPLMCYADRAQREFRWAASLRAQEWVGYRFGDPWLKLESTPPDPDVSELRNRLETKLAGCTVFPVLQLTPAKLDQIAELLAKLSPVLVDGDTEVLELFASQVLARGGLRTAPRGVVSTGQTLSERSRGLFASAFGCPVFDAYGTRETGRLGHESESHAGHLIAAEGYVVEILIEGRPAAPGEIGEVVITDLNGFAMPLIRYRTGDLAEAVDNTTKSPCGRGLPRLGEIRGRAQSILRGTSGQLVPGTFLTHAAGEFGFALKRLRAIQREPGSLYLRIVKGSRYSDDRLEELLALVRAQLGDDLEVQIEFDQDEPDTPSRRASISGQPVDLQRRGLRIAT